MLVVHDAARLIENFPTAFPALIAKVGVFQIKRPKQLVEAAQLEKLPAVEGAGSAAAVEARKGLGNSWIDGVTQAQAAILPPALRQSGFFAQLGRIAEEDL